ncbi:MAG: CPBP family intramembrane metalloprotease [Clostridia bacterium]|nr:CPBP family intramembrane metalloprotease [Clostridia bacterium]
MDDILNNDGMVPISEDLQKDSIRKPSILQISVIYSICVLLLLFVGSWFQNREFYSGILITEFVLIMLPPIVMLFLFKYDVKKVLRLNKVSITNLLMVPVIMAFALPLVGILNFVNLVVIKYIFGRIQIEQPPVATDATSLLINILVIGGSAGICEEILFRGTIQRGFERLGVVRAILITSLLFGLMHVDFQKLLGTFLLGALIGFIVYRTNSIYSGILAHFTNNSLAVILSFAALKLQQLFKNSGVVDENMQKSADIDFGAIANMPIGQLIASIIVYGGMIAFFGGIFAVLMFAFIKNTSKEVREIPVDNTRIGKKGLLALIPGLLPIALIYFLQGLSLKGINVNLVKEFFKIIGVN